jgi:hypothetical protein
LLNEEDEEKIVLKKGKTIFDYIGSLPSLGMSIEKMREKAVEEAVKENDLGVYRYQRDHQASDQG